MNNALHFASGNDDTGTPVDFYAALDAEFGFVSDMAATVDNAKHWNYYGPDQFSPDRMDCLAIERWPSDGANWLNPPYSEPEHACKRNCKKKLCVKRGFHVATYRPGCIDFVRKAAEQQMEGVTTVCLLAARTDTEWWHTYVWDADKRQPRLSVEVRFVRGRLKFEGHTDSAPFPSVVVIFRGRTL